MNISKERLARIQKTIKEKGLDALFCRLSEHVLYFTGYWPHNHVGAAVVPANGNPVLVMSELEAKLEFGTFKPSEGIDVVTFPLESKEVMRGPNDGFAVTLPGVFERLGLKDKVIGLELTVEGCNVGIFQGEVKYPAKPTWDMLKMLFPNANFVDGSGVIMELRAVKSKEEIEAIRLAVESAGLGFVAAKMLIKPGMKETELASVIESAIHNLGTGYKGITQARGYACVYTGARSADQWTHYANSTDRKIEKGDIVIVELGAFADGYWADLTRNFCAGEIPARAKEIFKIVRDGQMKAIEAAKPGTPISEVDRACRSYIEKHGYGDQFPHGMGHGVGMAYHEGPPLHMANNALLQENMVLTIEPGIYIPGFCGIRPEDMIVVRPDGGELISDIIPHELA